MSQKNKTKKTAAMFDYVLGRNPGRFGLVPDADGFVKIKDFIKAVTEEDGWRFVRQANINEVLLTVPDPPVEVTENRIRAVDRSHLSTARIEPDPPKLLHTCVRRRAWPSVIDRGIRASNNRIVLAADRVLAERMGKRIDAKPVLVTVRVADALDRGVCFTTADDTLYVTEEIPAGCYSGPPLPKEKPEAKKPDKSKESPEEKTPGTFLLNLDYAEPSPGKGKGRGKGRKKEIDWKKGRRQMRRNARKGRE